MKLTSEGARTYVVFKDMAWHIMKDRLAEPGPATLLDTLFQVTDRRARRLEVYMTAKYPLGITRRNYMDLKWTWLVSIGIDCDRHLGQISD